MGSWGGRIGSVIYFWFRSLILKTTACRLYFYDFTVLLVIMIGLKSSCRPSSPVGIIWSCWNHPTTRASKRRRVAAPSCTLPQPNMVAGSRGKSNQDGQLDGSFVLLCILGSPWGRRTLHSPRLTPHSCEEHLVWDYVSMPRHAFCCFEPFPSKDDVDFCALPFYPLCYANLWCLDSGRV